MSPDRRKARLRCATYTRVSSEAGLEQDFNSLDAQREAAEAYVKSQAHEGWTLLRGLYDDGGFPAARCNGPLCRSSSRMWSTIASRRSGLLQQPMETLEPGGTTAVRVDFRWS